MSEDEVRHLCEDQFEVKTRATPEMVEALVAIAKLQGWDLEMAMTALASVTGYLLSQSVEDGILLPDVIWEMVLEVNGFICEAVGEPTPSRMAQ